MTLPRRRHLAFASIAALLSVSGLTAAQTPTPPAPSTTTGISKAGDLKSSDRSFLMEAAQGGMAEVEMGRLAAQKASNENVKRFGQRMADDHGKANEELKQLAGTKGVSLPSTLDAGAKREHDRLMKLDGAAFDREYMRHMVRDHEKDIKAFRTAGKSSDADVQAFANKTLPTLEEHLRMAKAAEADVRGDAKRGANK